MSEISRHSNSFSMTPERLIAKVSAAYASLSKLEPFLRSVAVEVGAALGASWLRIDIAGAEGLPETHVEYSGLNVAAAGARFEITRTLEVRGVRYGVLNFELRNPAWSPAVLFQLTDVLAQQLSIAAEGFALRAKRVRANEDLSALRQEVVAHKAITRATGMLAARRGWTTARALEWLRQEATRSGEPLATLADRFVEGVVVQRKVKSGAIPGLARIA